jgi:alpha-1,2-mannosyltransferase
MRRLSSWLAVLVVAGGLYLSIAGFWVASRPASLGFDILLLRSAGERLLAGEPIYVDPTGASFVDPGPADFYGPPALAVAAIVLTPIPEDLVRFGSFPVSWVLVGLSLSALSARTGLRASQIAAVFIGAMAAFAVFWGATLGASSVWLLALLAGAFFALSRGSDVAAGVLIGTAAALRIYPVVLLVPLGIAGRWRAAGAAVGTFAGWGILGVVVAGPDATRTFIVLLQSLQGVEAGSSNVALEGLARVVSVVGGIALLVWAGLRMRRPQVPSEEALAWGLAFGGMLLVTPVVWDHYTTALLPLVVAIVALTGWPGAGLLSAAMLPASLQAGYVIVWLPIVGIIVALRLSRTFIRT